MGITARLGGNSALSASFNSNPTTSASVGGARYSINSPATSTSLGLVRVGENLDIDEDGILSVTTADKSEQDNTKPITSAAVHAEIGNINALLESI